MAKKQGKKVDVLDLKKRIIMTIAIEKMENLTYDELYDALSAKLYDVRREDIKNAVKDMIYSGSLSVSEQVKSRNNDNYVSGDKTNKSTISIGDKADIRVGKFIRHISGKGTIEGSDIFTDQNGKEVQRQVNFMLTSDDNRQFNDGSLVRYIVTEDKNGCSKATVLSVVKEGKNTIYGAFRQTQNGIVFVPVDSKRFGEAIMLEKSDMYEAHLGQLCGITIEAYCDHRPNKVTSIADFGSESDPHNYTKMVMDDYGYKKEFSETVLAQVDALGDKLEPKDYEGKEDYRDIPFVAIDPKTCKDRDDAMYAEPVYLGDRLVGYKLMVAIADVTHYVTPNSPVYKEAVKRQFSKYLGDEVVPMIPKKLSNGLCSLNKDEDRLSMVTTMFIDLDGNVNSFDVKEGIVNIRENLCYEDASALHHNDAETISRLGQYKDLVDMFYSVEKALGKSFKRRGALKITGTEPTIVYSEDGKKIVDYKNDNDLDSHEIVAKAMIINNIVISSLMKTIGVVVPNRIEEDPSEERCEDMVGKLAYLGIDAEAIPTCENYQRILSLISENKKIETIASNFVIRSLKKAQYSTDSSVGHSSIGNMPMDRKCFVNGIRGEISYSHFTSPIRRDVDLVLHQKLKEALVVINDIAKEHNIDTSKDISEYLSEVMVHAKDKFSPLNAPEFMESLCFKANNAETKDDEAEKLCDKRLASLYLKENEMGKVKNAIVTNIDGRGVTALLYDEADKEHSNIFEVQIPVKGLAPSKTRYELINNKNETIVKLGDEVKVVITDCEPINGIVKGVADFQKELNLTSYDD